MNLRRYVEHSASVSTGFLDIYDWEVVFTVFPPEVKREWVRTRLVPHLHSRTSATEVFRSIYHIWQWRADSDGEDATYLIENDLLRIAFEGVGMPTLVQHTEQWNGWPSPHYPRFKSDDCPSVLTLAMRAINGRCLPVLKALLPLAGSDDWVVDNVPTLIAINCIEEGFLEGIECCLRIIPESEKVTHARLRHAALRSGSVTVCRKVDEYCCCEMGEGCVPPVRFHLSEYGETSVACVQEIIGFEIETPKAAKQILQSAIMYGNGPMIHWVFTTIGWQQFRVVLSEAVSWTACLFLMFTRAVQWREHRRAPDALAILNQLQGYAIPFEIPTRCAYYLIANFYEMPQASKLIGVIEALANPNVKLGIRRAVRDLERREQKRRQLQAAENERINQLFFDLRGIASTQSSSKQKKRSREGDGVSDTPLEKKVKEMPDYRGVSDFSLENKVPEKMADDSALAAWAEDVEMEMDSQPSPPARSQKKRPRDPDLITDRLKRLRF